MRLIVIGSLLLLLPSLEVQADRLDRIIYTGDEIPREGPVVFLAGPTSRQGRTPWRKTAITYLRQRGYQGWIVVPEFESGLFDLEAQKRGWVGPTSPIDKMNRRSYEVVRWETKGIEAAEQRGVLLIWMPYTDPSDSNDSMPGFTTRGEYGLSLGGYKYRNPKPKLALGMPDTAKNTGFPRYHAAILGLPLWPTLEATCAATIKLLEQP